MPVVLTDHFTEAWAAARDRQALDDLARDLVAAGVPIAAVSWDAITHEMRPDLFEAPTEHAPMPWPLEPHNRGPIDETEWKPNQLLGTNELAHLHIGRWAEMLLDCEAHPGMIVRRVHVEFHDLPADPAATDPAAVLPPMVARP
jgi:hypothetical protein